jgi:hypothetical protein
MARPIGHPARNAAIVLAFFVFSALVGICLAAPPSSEVEAIAIGVASSLLATLVFAMVTGFLTGSRRLELDEQLKSVAGLGRDLSFVREAERHGIDAVKPKSAYGVEEWRAVLRGAERSLMMVGHALDKWCEETLEELFCEAIQRVIANGGEVRLLMLAEDADRIARLREKGYSKRIRRTLEVLSGINPTLEGSGSLVVCHLGDDLDMPYMAVSNDTEMIAGPYPSTAQSSDRMPAVRLSTESAIAQQILTDIRALFDCREVTEARLDRTIDGGAEPSGPRSRLLGRLRRRS